MKRSTPRLASDEVIEISNPEVVGAGLGTPTHAIDLPESLGTRVGNFVRGLIGVAIIATGVLAVTYLVLASTVLIVSDPLGSNTVVMRGAHPIGQVPSGAIVLASSDPVATDFGGKLMEGTLGVPAASTVLVVGGPAAEIRNDSSGQVIVNDEPSGYYAEVDAQSLGHRYVAICLDGACATGTAVLVGERSVVGEVKGTLGGMSFSKPDVPASATSAP